VLLTENVADFVRIASDHLSTGGHHPGVLVALSSRFSRRPSGSTRSPPRSTLSPARTSMIAHIPRSTASARLGQLRLPKGTATRLNCCDQHHDARWLRKTVEGERVDGCATTGDRHAPMTLHCEGASNCADLAPGPPRRGFRRQVGRRRALTFRAWPHCWPTRHLVARRAIRTSQVRLRCVTAATTQMRQGRLMQSITAVRFISTTCCEPPPTQPTAWSSLCNRLPGTQKQTGVSRAPVGRHRCRQPPRSQIGGRRLVIRSPFRYTMRDNVSLEEVVLPQGKKYKPTMMRRQPCSGARQNVRRRDADCIASAATPLPGAPTRAGPPKSLANGIGDIPQSIVSRRRATSR